MSTTEEKTYTGGCSCDYVKYRVATKPLIVHCCHCSYCQTQTGTAFALNALFVADEIELTQGEVKEIVTPSPSGKSQTIARCPLCHVAIWSNYYMRGLRERIRFLRVGTLDEPTVFPPDVHIYTSTKQSWFAIPDGELSVPEFYDIPTVWDADNLAKLKHLFDDLNSTN